METKDYIEAVIELAGKFGKKVLVYILVSLLATPFLNNFINPSWIYKRFLLQRITLNFTKLPFDSNLYQWLIWAIVWLVFFYIFEKFELEETPLKVWIFITKCFKPLELLKFSNLSSNWIFQGGVRMETYRIRGLEKNQMVVEDCNSGILSKEHFFGIPKRWKNFEMSFKVMFPSVNNRAVGVIFMAQDLENYYMIQIRAWRDQQFHLRLIPHVRFRGNWEVIDLQPNNLLANMTFRATAQSLQIKLSVKNSVASIYVRGVLLYEWVLPTNVEVNHIQHQNQEDRDVQEGNVPKIPFYGKFGSIGFRAYPGERSIIRDLIITPL